MMNNRSSRDKIPFENVHHGRRLPVKPKLQLFQRQLVLQVFFMKGLCPDSAEKKMQFPHGHSEEMFAAGKKNVK